MRKIKVEWCENFIKKTFAKLPAFATGIEIGCFWNMAEKSRLWTRGTYGSTMSQALEKLTTVKAVKGDNGEPIYYTFELK
jgi:hypothetical protein